VLQLGINFNYAAVYIMVANLFNLLKM